MTTNNPPIANAGFNQTLECSATTGTSVRLDGSASFDPDGDPLTFEWKNAVGAVVGTTATVNLALPLGSHPFTLTVSDGKGGTATTAVVITIRDTAAPTLGVGLSPSLLWPPDHKLEQVAAAIQVRDVCDASPRVSLVSITSNEPDDGLGDGDTAGDIQDAAFGTDDRAFFLRAERSGKGTGRVYTVTYLATDASGNLSSASATVTVPRDQSKP